MHVDEPLSDALLDLSVRIRRGPTSLDAMPVRICRMRSFGLGSGAMAGNTQAKKRAGRNLRREPYSSVRGAWLSKFLRRRGKVKHGSTTALPQLLCRAERPRRGASHLPVCPVRGSPQRAQSCVGAGLRLRPMGPRRPPGADRPGGRSKRPSTVLGTLARGDRRVRPGPEAQRHPSINGAIVKMCQFAG